MVAPFCRPPPPPQTLTSVRSTSTSWTTHVGALYLSRIVSKEFRLSRIILTPQKALSTLQVSTVFYTNLSP